MSDYKQKKQVPVVKGWVTMPPDEPRIIASKCKSCGDIFFPRAEVCRNPFCKNKGEGVEEIRLSRTGKLKSFSINYYRPPLPYHAPDPFVPFGVCQVTLPEGLNMLAQAATGTEKDLKIGMEVELVLEKYYEDEEGNDVNIYKYRPVAS